MKIRVKVIGGEEKELEIKSNSKILNVIKKLQMSPEVVVVKKDDHLVPLDEKIKKGNKLEIIKVISGG